jgi:hypothetical protein
MSTTFFIEFVRRQPVRDAALRPSLAPLRTPKPVSSRLDNSLTVLYGWV